jgi:5-methylcytosine-specific restriction endonuclease McrA
MDFIRTIDYSFDTPVVFSRPAEKKSYIKTTNRDEMRRKAQAMLAKGTNFDQSKPTRLDTEVWWSYLKEHYPLNYKLAKSYYNGESDPNLEGICKPRDLNINDYFELYNLHRVTAKDDEVRVDGKLVSKYRPYADYVEQRRIFDEAHKKSAFWVWKRRQYVCQDCRCAWCKKHVEMNEVEVDHVKPLAHFGSNRAGNLVLACRDCNREKMADMYGWNEQRDRGKLNARPSWIKFNPHWDMVDKAIAEAGGSQRWGIVV